MVFIHRSSLPIFLLLIATACQGAAEEPLPGSAPAIDQSIRDTLPPSEDAGLNPDLPPGQTPSQPDTSRVALVDTTIAPGVAGDGRWGYAVRSEADLDGDGQPETVVAMARVEMYQGRPAWDDGQPWQVYVEEPDGRRTYLYSRFVQLGTITMRVGLPEGAERPSVILLEHLPDQLSLYEIEYLGPNNFTTSVRFQRTVDPRGETASPTLP